MNTVVLSGRGIKVAIILNTLQRHFEDSVLTTPTMHWWEDLLRLDIKYQLRFQNLSLAEIEEIEYSLSHAWARDIKVDIF